MYFLAPLVYMAAFSWIFYQQKEVLSQDQYDIAEKNVKQFTAWEKQQKEQGKARKGVVEQFQTQSAYGSDITRLQASSQFTLMKSY